MRFIKALLVFLASSFLTGTLLLFATFWTLNATIGQRQTVKSWISDSGLYDNFVSELTAAASEELQKETAEGDSEVANAIDADTLTGAAETAFTPEFLQTSVEDVIDGSYNWLEETSPNLEFRIDLTEAKNSFIDAVATTAQTTAEALPACPVGEVPPEFDPFSADCLPSGVNIADITEQYRSSLSDDSEFLPDPIIDASDAKIADENDVEQTIDEAFSDAPRIFGLAKTVVWYLLGLSVLLTTIIIFLSKSKRAGVKHMAKIFFSAALSSFVTGIFAQIAPTFTTSFSGAGNTTEGFAEGIILPIMQEAADDFASWSYRFAGIFLLLSSLCLVLLIIKRRKSPDGHQQQNTKHPQPQTQPEPAKPLEHPTGQNAHAPDHSKDQATSHVAAASVQTTQEQPAVQHDEKPPAQN